MATIKTFKEGIEEILSKIELNLKPTNQPYIISINGQPNSGKTELRKKIIKQLHNNQKNVWTGMTGDYTHYPLFTKQTEVCIIEDLEYLTSAWRFSKEYFGKEADIRIYLTTTNTVDKRIHTEYDMIIVNPEAKIK